MNKNCFSVMTSVIAVSLLSITPAHSVSFTDPVDGMFDMGEFLAENAYGFMPVPILLTEPAIGYGGGVMGIFLHESEEQKEKRKKAALESIEGGAQLATPAISAIGIAGTENDTWFTFAGHRTSFKQDTIRYTIGAAYGDVFMKFYSKLNLDNKRGVELNMQGAGGMQRLLFRVPDSSLFLGATQYYLNMDLAIKDRSLANDILGRITNTSPTLSALSLTAQYDNLNSFLYPSEGHEYSFEHRWFNDSIGSDYDYSMTIFKGASYWPLSKTVTLGTHFDYNRVDTNESSLPVFTYPDINIRGIARNRYQGEVTSTIQSQIMWRFQPRYVFSVFGGVGSATNSQNDLYSDNQLAGGFGIRYLMARRYGLHLGVDIAFSEEEEAIYFNVGTGF